MTELNDYIQDLFASVERREHPLNDADLEVISQELEELIKHEPKRIGEFELTDSALEALEKNLPAFKNALNLNEDAPGEMVYGRLILLGANAVMDMQRRLACRQANATIDRITKARREVNQIIMK